MVIWLLYRHPREGLAVELGPPRQQRRLPVSPAVRLARRSDRHRSRQPRQFEDWLRTAAVKDRIAGFLRAAPAAQRVARYQRGSSATGGRAG
jgi:hypothetical protein